MKPPRVVKEKQRWAVVQLDDGWQAVLPTPDDMPHSTLILVNADGSKEADLAGWECPCKPKVEWKDKIIVHNSFEEMSVELHLPK